MKIKLKEILFTITVLGVFSSLNASHVKWYNDFEAAHREALKQNKHLMVLLIKKDCPTCQNSLITTFMNQPYIDKINDEYIPVLVTKDQEQSYPIEMLYTLVFPTLFFLDKYELFSCEPIRGEITPQILKNHLEICN